MKTISDYMTEEVIVIDSNMTVIDAIDRMKQENIGAILVLVEEEGEKIGIFTERDLLSKIDLRNTAELSSLKIKDVMTAELTMIDADEPYVRALEIMHEKNVRHLPVVKENRVVGIVSVRDLIHNYQEELKHDLQIQEAQLQAVFEYSPVAITLTDQNERIIAWNPLTKDLFGMEDDDLRGKPVKEFYPEEKWERIRSLNIRKQGFKNHLEVKMIKKDGEIFNADVSISVLRDKQDNVSGSIGIIQSIAYDKKTEEIEELKGRVARYEQAKVLRLRSANNKTEEILQDLTQKEIILKEKSKMIKEFYSQLDAKNLELKTKIGEIARSNELMMGRELRVIELKQEINELLKESGKQSKYIA